MSKIDIYSKFISKQTKIAENSSISRNIKEAEEDKSKDTSDAKKKLDDMKIKDLEDKAKKAGIDSDNPDMKSAADANGGNVTASARIGGSATGGEGKIFDRKINGKDVPLSSASDTTKSDKSTDTSYSTSKVSSGSASSMDDYYKAHTVDSKSQDVPYYGKNEVGHLGTSGWQDMTSSSGSGNADRNFLGKNISGWEMQGRQAQDDSGKMVGGAQSSSDPKPENRDKLIPGVSKLTPNPDPLSKVIGGGKLYTSPEAQKSSQTVDKRPDAVATTDQKQKQSISKSKPAMQKKKDPSAGQIINAALGAVNVDHVEYDLNKQIIEKYSCGDKMKKKKDK